MAKGTELKRYIGERLLEPKFAAAYIVAAIEENDPDFLNQALEEVVKAHGISRVASETGIARQAIYSMISQYGNPTLQNINKILNALGLEITVRPKRSAS